MSTLRIHLCKLWLNLAKIRLKVYGAVKGEKRFIRKHHYYTVLRDKYGHFKTCRKWSPKKPNKPDQYKEKYIETEIGKEARQKVAESVEEEQWKEYEVEYA